MRKPLAIGAAVVVLVAIPTAVIAASGAFNGSVDRQSAAWTTSSRTITSARWRDVPQLTLTRCTRAQVTAMLNVTMQPGRARFSPDGTESFSFDFARRTEPVEGDDTHTFTVQWRSPSRSEATLERGLLNLLFQSCP
jgi:hypothetical protein